MADVRPRQYLLGVGLYVWAICMIGAGLMATGLDSADIPFYMTVMSTGFVISIIGGACVGIYARNQMTATSVVMPVMMVFSFAPMLAMFNKSIDSVAGVLYTRQLKGILDDMTFNGLKTDSICILSVNAMLMVILFFILFRKKGLE